MAAITAYDQWLLEMINRIRLDPEGILGTSLNDGLPPGTISGESVQPLAMNDLLVASAQYHVNWMLENDTYGTVGEQGSDPGDRMAVAGYDFQDPWSWGEVVDRKDFAADAPLMPGIVSYAQYFWGRLINEPEVRALLLAPDLSEAGIGQYFGASVIGDGVVAKSALLAIDLASTANGRFITGMVFYEPLPGWLQPPMNGRGGVQVTGTDDSNVTSGTGGYAIKAISDHQSVTIGQFQVEIEMGAGNAKLDLVDNSKLLSSASIKVLTGPYYAYLIGAGDVDILMDPLATTTEIRGNRGDNHLFGNRNANRLDGGEGIDILEGGQGDDTYTIKDTGDIIVERLGEGFDKILASVSYTLTAGAHVEELGTDNQNLPWNLQLAGNELSQKVKGNNGSNVLDGGGGGDTLTGYAGNDTYIVRDGSDIIIETGGTNNAGQDKVLAAVNFVLAADDGIERLETLDPSGTAALQLTGNSFAQALVGNAGANRLYGMGGDDMLDGGLGADRLYGGAGNDQFVISDAGDKAYENNGEGTDVVLASVGYSIAGQYVENLTLTGAANIDGAGNTQSNIITGNSGDNRLDGGAGGDAIYGGLGSDTFVVDNTKDRAYESVGEGTDTVLSSVTYSLVGQYLENLTLTGVADVRGTGNSFVNEIRGNSATNILDGGLGGDILFGGDGSDRFVFSTKLHASNVDTILDFTVGQDRFRLDIDIFTAFTATGTLSAGAFKNLATGAVDANDRILFDQATGDVSYDSDGSGLRAAVRFATLDNDAIVTASDFLLV